MLILLIIFITNQFVHYLNDAASGKITIQAVMEVMTLQVPLFLGYLLPLSLFLGILLTLGRFHVDHEMVVLSACGISRAQLVAMIMFLASIVMFIVAWLMLSVEPKMQWYQGKILTNAVATASLDKILPGRFQSLGSGGKVFYAGKFNKHHDEMGDVFLAQNTTKKDGVQSWDIVNANKASQLNTKTDGQFVLFKNGIRYVGVPGELKYHVAKFKTYGIRLTNPVTNITGRIEAMPTSKLWYLQKTNPKAAAEFQWRLAMPLSVFIFALLAVPLSQVNPRKGKFAQMLPAVLIYIVYANFMFAGRAWIEKGIISQDIGLWWIHGSLLLLAFLLLALQKNQPRLFSFFRSK